MFGRRPLPGVMRTIVLFFAVAAVGFAAYDKYGSHDSAAHTGVIRLLYAYSSNQEDLLLPLIRRNLRLLNGLNQQAGDVIVLRRVSSEEVEINHDAGRAMFSHWR